MTQMEDMVRKYLASRPEAYDRLTPLQKDVLKGRLDERLTYQALAARLGMTRERARAHEAEALNLLLRWASKDVGRCPHCQGTGYLAHLPSGAHP